MVTSNLVNIYRKKRQLVGETAMLWEKC